MRSIISRFVNRSRTNRSRRGERGQVIFIAAAFIAIMAGGAAMAIDVGSYLAHRRTLQNSVDAIALAASQNLPNGDSAHAAANEWAMKNDVDINSMNVIVTQQSLPNEYIEDDWRRDGHVRVGEQRVPDPRVVQ